ncbi:MAG: hypothetical protein ACTSRZ_08360 [Promethearchaeota archaeon]
MPIGLLVMRWDERIGAEIVGRYPADLKIDDKVLMQLYAQHEYSGEMGTVSLLSGNTNLLSGYSGPETRIYAILVLEPDKDGFEYEEPLMDVIGLISETIDNPETVQQLLPNYFMRINAFPKLTEEQKIAAFYNDEVKRIILKRLSDETFMNQSELQIWLRDKYKKRVITDINPYIEHMLKLGLVKRASIKGDAGDYIFLIRDIMMLRIPPEELIKDPVKHHLPKSLEKLYIEQVTNFFKNYKINEDDSLAIISKVLLDPAVYEVLKLMRVAIVTKNDLEKLKKKGVDDPKRVMKILWELKMMVVLEDEKKTQYYALISDFYVGTYYPAYNLDKIMHHYKINSRSPQSLITALQIMKEEYFNQFPKSKKKAIRAGVAHT